ncbi:CRTAC1 family protein [Shewanella benthica]|uniref:CRTAC1 family protein n=1 Tax=Shewanella benthica TaxID=43661 RepID=UPI00187AECF4|nr:CRTAC1 family protein [Shewanella benthica]MBE7213928.1 CRTAC1 family protein [Shewanella benthica]MCL1061834.1 CRTAC1 family protein [Shewanella benthica]
MRESSYAVRAVVSLTNHVKLRHLKLRRFALSSICAAILSTSAFADSLPQQTPLDDGILRLMGKLESAKDPKCHATATRLEGLIFGTPLTENARYAKTEFQKRLVRDIWQIAAEDNPDLDPLGHEAVLNAANALFTTTTIRVGEQKSSKVTIGNVSTEITERDQQHYGSIAYTLRAMLAVQQDVLLDFDIELPELSDSAAEVITQKVDLLTLTLLKIADEQARQADKYQVSVANIHHSWQLLFPQHLADKITDERVVSSASFSTRSTGILMRLIEQKIAAFEQYNDVNQTLFARNLQVYFAKLAMPDDTRQAAEFKQYLTEAMIAFAGSLYLDAQSQVLSGSTIKEEHVAASLTRLLPHTVNEFEDVIFYPNYPKDKQVVIESYDMDSFRDSGLHWLYLREALVDAKEMVKLEADPFAAELLSEAVAHYGVLLLRNAGIEGKRLKQEFLSADLISISYQMINNEISAYAVYQPKQVAATGIISAGRQQSSEMPRYFINVTEQRKFHAEHRSSDWLSRQLRSYLDKDEQTGIITIPPAFGGSGIAAEDVDGDGLADILILSGLGNKLYLNRGDYFEDVTESAGLSNQSHRAGSGGLPGEPRQPLIADFDNDGDQDIMITYVDEPHRIYRNDGNAKFTEMTHIAQLGGNGAVGGPATTFDVNNDGLLDIYIQYFGNYLQGDLPTLKRRNDNGGENVLFINQGGFKFTQAPNALGANNKGWGQAVTHTDLNMDGWQDLIVGNDFGVNAYYINQKGQGFIDYAHKIGTDKPSYTMNISLSDLNRDGVADIYVSNIVTMNKDQKYVLPSEDTTAEFNPDKLANMRVVEGNDLFLSTKNAQGGLKYQHSDLVGRGYSSTGWAWDADFFDVDNDGDDDLYVLNGMNDYYVYSTKNPYYTDPHTGKSMDVDFPDAAKAANVFFLNSGGKLNNVSALSGLDLVANSRSATYLDMDMDGDLDVVINNYHGPAQIFENQAEKLKNNWLKIHLQGSPEDGVNLDGIGAQIIIGTDTEGYSWRQVSGSQGYMSVHPKTQHMGLGKSTKAKVMVIWPNGQRQYFDNVEANRSYTIRYPSNKKVVNNN